MFLNDAKRELQNNVWFRVENSAKKKRFAFMFGNLFRMKISLSLVLSQ